jgi:hypothetical protein
MGIIAGKFITGSQLVYEKPVATTPGISDRNIAAIKSLSELRTSDKVEIREDAEGNKVIVQVDKRLSSYFLVDKESDYLDHNIRNK